MPKTVDDVEMVRITIRLPKYTLEELEQMAKESGMYSQHFLQASVIAGARLLAQVFNNQLALHPTTFEESTPQAQAEVMTLREKADKLRRTPHRPPARSRAQDYMEGLLGEVEEKQDATQES